MVGFLTQSHFGSVINLSLLCLTCTSWRCGQIVRTRCLQTSLFTASCFNSSQVHLLGISIISRSPMLTVTYALFLVFYLRVSYGRFRPCGWTTLYTRLSRLMWRMWPSHFSLLDLILVTRSNDFVELTFSYTVWAVM